jgi:hypothetical protein
MHIAIPDKKGLREFGLVTGALLVGLFGVLLPWLFHLGFPLWPWIIAGILWGLALLLPMGLKLIYHGWMFIALILLALVFYLIITPLGLIMRLWGKQPMQRFQLPVTSYRQLTSPRPPQHLERPF